MCTSPPACIEQAYDKPYGLVRLRLTATLTATSGDDDDWGDGHPPRSQPQTDVAGRRAQNLQARGRRQWRPVPQLPATTDTNVAP